MDIADVKFVAKDYLPNENFDNEIANSRKVSCEERLRLGDNLSQISASNYQYDLFKNSIIFYCFSYSLFNYLAASQKYELATFTRNLTESEIWILCKT